MAGRPGRKPKKTIEEQIEQVSKDIETYKESIKTLEKKREELLKEKRERDLCELYEIIENSNLSVEGVKTIIEEYKYERGSEEQKLEVI